MAERRHLHRLLVLGVAVVTALAGHSLISAPQPTRAVWTVTKDRVVTVQAVTPAPPTGLTCGAGSGLLSNNVPFTWTAPAGTAPSGYTVRWSGAATSSTTSSTTSASVPPPIGTITVTVYADYGSWQSVVATQTRQVSGIAFVGWTCT